MQLEMQWNGEVVRASGAKVKKAAPLAALACLLAISAFAQNIGSVLGTVKDNTGAVMPKVAVVATNNLTSIQYKTVTNSLGDYLFPNLPQGRYTFTFSATSFRTEQVDGIEVHLGSTVRQDAALELATLNTQVQVVSSTPLVNSETSEIGIQTYSEQIRSLPMNGRNVYSLIFLTAGTDSEDAGGYQGKPSVTGSRPGFARFLIDGVEVDGMNTASADISPSVDAVQEFRFETSMAPASEASTSNIRVALKSGTNKFHGTAFDFFRNNVLDAHNYFDRPIVAPGYSYQRSQLRYNQFGGTLGGPVIRDKTFFFFSYEATRDKTANQVTGMYPTAAMLLGDFSGIDPTTGAAQTKFHTIYRPQILNLVPSPFPGNKIDVAFNAFATKFNPLILTANCMACDAAGLGFDFVGTSPGYANADAYIGRMDHNFSSKDTLSGSVDILDSRSSSGASASAISRNQLFNRSTLFTIAETHIISPTLLNEFRGGYMRHPGKTGEQGDAQGQFTFQNTPFSLPSLHPALLVQGYTTMGNGRLSGYQRAIEQSFYGLDNITWAHGNHHIKSGFEFRRTHSEELGYYNGVFQYLNNVPYYFGFTQNGFADYLLGIPVAGLTAQGAGRVNLLERSTYALYLQDDWKVASRLTLNLGLRWEYPQPWHGNNPALGRLGTLDTSAASFALGGRFLLGGSPDYYLASAQGIVKGNGPPLIRESIVAPNWRDFAPRVGLAYRPFNNNRTAIRGGFGTFFAVPDASDITSMASSPPYFFLSTYTNLLFPKAPITVDNFFPPPAAGQAGSQGVNPQLPDPRYYQWTLSLEHQLFSHMMVAAEYIGGHGIKLPIAMPINDPGLPNSTQLATLLATPSQDTTMANARRPWQGIPLSYSYVQPIAASWYNALNLRAEGRFGSRLTFSGLYTWAKALDESSYISVSSGVSSVSVPTMSTNLALNKSYADFDHTHRMVGDVVYTLPFGNQILKPSNAVLKKLADGWQVTGIVTMQTGAPYKVTTGADTSFRGSLMPVYPIMTGPPVRSNIRSTNGIFLTPQNFTVPPFGQLGTLARNAFHGPGINNFDIGFMKNVPIKERLTLQFRAEMFNAFNHAQFTGGSSGLLTGIAAPASGTTTPVLQYTDPSLFGRVSANPSRVVQLALKVIW